MRTLPLSLSVLLSVLLFACIEAPPGAESGEADAQAAADASRRAPSRPHDAAVATPDAARRTPAPPPDLDAPAPPLDASPPPFDAAPPPPPVDAAPDAAPPAAVDADAACAAACADEGCRARCAALAGALTRRAFTTWATCMADDPAAGPGACLDALDCTPADDLIGQHCDAIGRCDSVGRGWFDEAACRDDPYAQTTVWSCLRPDRRAELSACLAGSTCDALDTCLRYAACADDTVCPELIATELIAE